MRTAAWYSRFAKAAAHFCGRPRVFTFAVAITQNRDTEAIQLKLDELIRATQGAHNALLDLEELEEENLDVFKSKYQALAATARPQLEQGRQDTGTPEP